MADGIYCGGAPSVETEEEKKAAEAARRAQQEMEKAKAQAQNGTTNGSSQTTNLPLKQYVQPCSTSVGTQNSTSSGNVLLPTAESVLKSFIIPAAKVVEKANEVKEAAEVAHVELPLLENATWLGPAGALAAGYVATEEYNNEEISLGRASYNGTTPAVATAVALTVTPTAGAVVGTGFVVGALGYNGVNAAAKMLNDACTGFYYQAVSPLIPGGY